MGGASPTVQQRVLEVGARRIAYQVRGRGPVIVLANGLGGSFAIWRYLCARLDGRRFISWSYRGMFGSSPPATSADAAIPRQAEDIAAVLAHEGVQRALLVGWSMGVNVCFELCRIRPDLPVGLVGLNAPPPRGLRGTGTALRAAAGAVASLLNRAGAPLLERGVRRAARWRLLIPLLRRLGVVGATVDERSLAELIEQFAGSAHDRFEVYGETLQQVATHDYAELLPRLTFPALLIAGSRDRITPLAASREIAMRLPAGRLVVIDGGTHYTLVEHADRVNHHIEAFARTLGQGRQ